MAGIGSAPGIILGVGVGAATSAALAPAIEVPKQEAWASAPNRILDAATLARLVAQGAISLGAAQEDGKRDGFAPDKIAALTYLSQTVPGIGAATDLWRKGLLGDDLFVHSLNKSGLDERYVAPIVANKTAELLGLGDIAYAVVRGILPAPAYVPVAPPASGDKVPRYPQVNVDPERLAAELGYSPQALEIMVGRSGLSMAPGMAAQAYFRQIIGPNDYLLAIAEGDLRTEWADPVREVSRAIPTPLDGTEGHLRGWLTQAQMYDVTARHGMTQADTDLLYSIRRRPLSPHQIKQALARGGTFDAAQAPFADPYTASVHEANLGPEWYDLAVHLAGAYPSIFQTNRLVTGGTISATDGVSWLHKSGMADEVVTAMEAAWTKPGSSAADKDVASAATKLKTRVHSSYVAAEIDDATATTALTAAGVPAASIPKILSLYAEERSLVRKQLTPTQIRKAVSGAIVNPATGQPWTQAEALAALEARGYSAADAQTFMAE